MHRDAQLQSCSPPWRPPPASPRRRPSATTPTSPPPLTVLSQTGSLGNRDIFITPSGMRLDDYASGPEILSPSGKVVWFDPGSRRRVTTGDFRTQTYDGQHVLTFWQGTGFGGSLNRHRLHLQRPLRADRDRQGRQRPERRRTRVPDHALEHGADPRLPAVHGQPDLDRRPGQPDRDQRRRAGDRHPHRQGPVPVEQRRARALQPERAGAAVVGEHARGTGSTSTP